ncbi:hypothetical protein [Clostridium gasigenes]|uniref:Uncharacterized protein n=1 Tax=Clostridium gasigenes TaxID=94869 RepID=A0A1H0S8H5_9CLOT|nr:hypothetical protein [Clostridium gasigenes]MBB6622781.1 hypothetical protein [Clostridium gasigenes]MBB6714373.1 hypothetical protein [Clostridium gasigenes]MBU3089462.1 hypothetical protein [Clostridium gasigenes]MBU3103693.1 hypothetical protein [Clostridium gasigenes]MBU3108358.1 hypothetical protein [Clostridium gasigenes]
MSKCPFWSTKKERVNCYDECPMNGMVSQKEACPFKKVLDETKIAYKDIENENFAYSQEKHGEYDFFKKMSSY